MNPNEAVAFGAAVQGSIQPSGEGGEDTNDKFYFFPSCFRWMKISTEICMLSHCHNSLRLKFMLCVYDLPLHVFTLPSFFNIDISI